MILLFSLLILASSTSFAQDEKICTVCKKPVASRYLIIEGKTFHPEHFLCAKCGKPIEGSYIKKEGKFFHPGCYSSDSRLVCDKCGKPLEGDYILSEGKKYHTECYNNFILPKCDVCLQPLKESYTIDIYGTKYHTAHLSEMSKCDCCERIISQATTGGGCALSDGRHICNLCYSTAVYNQRDIERAFDLTAQRLIGMGINLNLKKIKITGVNRSGLKNVAEGYTDKMQGYCNAQVEKEYINGRQISSVNSHTIYVLNYLPSAALESVIAHELMHAWIFENTKNSHSARVREGACNYTAYLYLKGISPKAAADQLLKLEKNPDPVYGTGFREIRDRFENKALREFLSYLKE